MVDLPGVSRRPVFVDAPQRSGDPGAAAQMMGRSLQNIGGAISQFAEEQRRATEVATLAKLDSEADRKRTELQMQFQNDPQGFDNAWKGFSDSLMANSPLSQESKTRLGASLQNAGTRTWGQLAVQNSDRISKENVSALQTRISDQSNKMFGLAEAGRINDPEFQEARADIERMFGELTTNKTLNVIFPKEKAASELSKLDSTVRGIASIKVVEDTYAREGFAAAEKVANRFRDDSSLNLTPEERQRFYNGSLARIRLQETERRAIDREYMKEATDLRRGIEAGTASDQDVTDALDRYGRAGATNAVAVVAQAAGVRRMTRYIESLPGEQRVQAWRAARGAAPTFSPDVDGAIKNAAAEIGVDEDMLRRFAKIESSGDPSRVKGSYKGLFQMGDGEWARFGRGDIFNASDNAMAAARKLKNEAASFKAQYGREPTAGDIYMVHQQGAGGYAKHMENPDRPAWQNMLDTAEGRQKGAAWAKEAIWGNVPDHVKPKFGSVENVTSRQFTEYWKGRVDGGSSSVVAAGPGAATAGAAVPENVPQQVWINVQKSAQKEIADYIPNFRAAVTAYERPDPEEVKNMTSLVGAFGTEKQKADFTELMAAQMYGDELAKMPSMDREKTMAAIREDIDAGGTQFTRDMMAAADKRIDAVEKGFREDPYDMAMQTQIIHRTPPLDPTRPQQFVQGLLARQADGRKIQMHENLPAFSAISNKDLPGVQMALRSQDPNIVRSVVTAVGQLDQDVSRATLKQLKPSLVALANTSDPASHSALFEGLNAVAEKEGGLDALHDELGEDMVRQYQTWRGRFQYMDPKDYAQALKDDRNPSLAPVRKEARETARREANSKDGGNRIETETIVDWFDDRTFSDPAQPVDARGNSGVLTGWLRDDAVGIYAERRAEGMPHDQAVKDTQERIKRRWGTTDVGGWRVMRNPPERYYQGLSADEMRAPVVEAVRAQIAKDHPDLAKPTYSTLAGVPSIAPDVDFSLIPDSRTESDIAAGRPPSYVVGIRLPNGKTDVLRRDGEVTRVSWGDQLRAKQAAKTMTDAEFNRKREWFKLDAEALSPNAPPPRMGSHFEVAQ
jgi:hypothetical protein